MNAVAAVAPHFMTRRQAEALEQGKGRAAAQHYARAHARAWARLRSLEALLGDQSPGVLAENELHPGAAAAHAGDLDRVVAILGDAIRVLGKGGAHA